MSSEVVARKGAFGMWKAALVVAAAAAASALFGTVASAQVAPPEPPGLTLQKVQLLDPNQLVVDGTIECQVMKDFSVSVRVTELGVKDAVKNSTEATGPCTVAGPQAWSVTVRGSGGTFVPVVTTFGKITDPTSRQSVTNVDQRGVVVVKP